MTDSFRLTLALALLSPLSLACASDPEVDDDPTARKYYEDVAPILAANCYQCHRENAVAPFVLQEYDDVEPLGELLAHVTEARTMPPWLAEGSGACGSFRNSAWLADEDVATIQEWVDDGKRPGNPDMMPEFTVRQETLIDTATHTLEMSTEYTPAGDGNDDYRCFVIEPGITKRSFLTAYEIVPGDPKIVHHVLVYSPTSDAAVDEVRALDAAEDGDGFTCFGGPGSDEVILSAAWAPGRMVWEYPEGMGVPIEPNRPQIVQMHYNLLEGVSPDKTVVRLRMADEIATEILPWFFANTELALPGGQSNQVSKFEISTGVYMRDGLEQPELAVPMDLIGIAPHMHKMGKTEHVELASADGLSTTCLLDVPRWDFNWQFAYFFEQPIRVNPEDLLRMTCGYDTSSATDTTFWGDGTQDEMCLTLMFSTFPGGKIPTE